MNCTQCGEMTGHDVIIHDGQQFCSSECVKTYRRSEQNESITDE